MNVRYAAFRLAAMAFPTRDSLLRAAKRVARATGVDARIKGYLDRAVREQVMGVLYPELLARLKSDVGIEGSRQHMEDLLALLDHRVDRLCRELAKQDPAMAFEPPAAEEKKKETRS